MCGDRFGSRGLPLRALILGQVLLFAGSTLLLAGPTGKIAGRVTDANTGEALPGVNVLIVGTTQGTVTDIEGYYFVLNVKPGTYQLRASFIGYTPVTVEDVKVVVDRTTTIDFQLGEQVIEGQEVVVTAERPIVEIDRTTTTAVVDSEQLEALPVTNVRDAVELQAGVSDGHFRGGRTGEVAYLVNGVPINNVYSNDASFDIEQNMVESLEVISGVFNAEYGQALSGVVNIVTKDLPSEWSGEFLGYVGGLASSRELEFITRRSEQGSFLPADAFVAENVTYTEAAEFPNLTDIQASLGGPILNDKLGFQATVRYLKDNSHFIGRNLFAPGDSSQNLNTGLDRAAWIVESSGDGDFVPLNATERISVNASLGYQITPTVKLDYNLFLQDGDFQPYSHFRKYVPEGINKVLFLNQTHIVGLRYTIGSRSFGNVSYSYLRDKTDVRLYDSPFDERYVSSDNSALQGANAFAVGGNDLFTVDELTSTHTFVADFSRQIGRIHLMKVGVQTRLHNLDNRSFGIERSFRTGNLPQPSPDQFSDNSLKTNPLEFAAYLQDKMEFTGLIVNAGLRFDYFDPDYQIPVDWAQAQFEEIPDPANPSTTISNRVDADVKMQLSPRLGIAFPISATGVMRFSSGLFFQIPPLTNLYANPEYEVNPVSSVTFFGNPNIDPERTLAFELGLQQGLTDRIAAEVTLFSKDVRNLLGVGVERNPNGDFVVRNINRDYGTIRGFTLSLEQRPGGMLDWTIDYTLQFAEGTSSSVGEAFQREQDGLEPILSLVRLNWDRRHILNTTLSVKPIDDLTVTFINRMRSGEPYTTVRDFVVSNKKNNGVKPTLITSDVRAFYSPSFLGPDLELFFQIQNIFDIEQEVNVYSDTGRADESVELELFRRTGAEVGGLNTLDEFFYRQEFFGAPRKVSLGLKYSF